ncbi:hypothetical protein [Candidatus Uabimicrobium amorphum]|uniref:Uncharacterized protein n=1 Tax=Uabimicrobium amorphum TaxID=2596890 RepID=A0A5S9IM91_UABAM|nr:hypothetical protein [Candidatus Uabimicrobium amorphum]BBM84130.1 hypothetical protein UABAM_02486 [Candidatus Uabimicrobium amorphum]
MLAYIDPGSGSLLIQAIIALFFGAIFYLKASWRKFISLFSRKKDTSEDKSDG